MKYLVIAKPNARQEKVEKIDESTLRVSIKSPPKNNQANDEIINLLAKYFGVSPSKIRLLGASSKYKHVIIDKAV